MEFLALKGAALHKFGPEGSILKHEKILVTGSSGLIGTAVCAVLASQGHEVLRFDIADQNDGFGDILTPTNLDVAMKGCTGVVHLSRLVLAGQRLAGMIPLFHLIWRTGYGGQNTIAGNGFEKIGS